MWRVVKPGGRLAVAVWDARIRGGAAILHEADSIVTFDAPG
jgi:hypothetical protein